ncbi:MAG: 30S ribosomal protein S1 [Anaerolineales bacterium]
MDTPDEGSSSAEDDFALLMEAVDDMSAPKVGELLHGHVISVDSDGAVIGLGLKRDGFVPRADLDRAAKTVEPGDKIIAVLVSAQGREGNLELSVFQARQNEDWLEAEALRDSGELWVAEVSGYNRGGLIVPFGGLRGFVPASHVVDLPRGMSESDRQAQFARLVGTEMGLKVIEVDRRRRRLVLSQREAQREWRARRKAELLASLEEGKEVTGVVSGMREFGAFVDLGGADGLIHVSELAWQRVEHPREVVAVGDEVRVMVIRVDVERNRIGLSLKRLQPDPWERVAEQYSVDQEVTGRVTRLAPFGAFIDLGDGIEGLLHNSETPPDMEHAVTLGAELRVRVANVEAARQRIGLSLHGVAFEPSAPEIAPAEALADDVADTEPESVSDDEQTPIDSFGSYDSGDEPDDVKGGDAEWQQ